MLEPASGPVRHPELLRRKRRGGRRGKCARPQKTDVPDGDGARVGRRKSRGKIELRDAGERGGGFPSNLTVKRVSVKILFVNGLFRLNGAYSQNVPFISRISIGRLDDSVK